MKRILVSLVFALFLISFVSAIDYPSYTDKYVNDFASVLNSEQVAKLRGLFAGVDSDATAEMVFVSDKECASKGGSSAYAIGLLNEWKVGKADKNNGFLILYCLEENKIFATTGYGLEGILPDSKIGRLLDENYIPLRDSGNVSQGIVDFSKVVSDVIEQNREEVLSGQAGGSDIGSVEEWIFLAIVALFIISIIIGIKNAVKRKKNADKKWKMGNKKSYGIKSSWFFNTLGMIFSIGVFIGLIFGGAGFIAVVVFIILEGLFKWLIGVRCEKDGKKMKSIGHKGDYELYRCPHGHVGGLLSGAATGAFTGWMMGGGGGGGFSGGGFGGGGGGGGGAGR
jgi:uncharacterized membrane protein YgcG